MLYVLTGDAKKISEKSKEMVSALVLKKTGVSVFKFNSENFSQEKIEGLVFERGLFIEKHIVVCSKIFENESAKDFLLKNLAKIAESENIFILVEEKIDAQTFKKIKEKANKVQEFDVGDAKRDGGEMFGLTDLLLQRDRKRMWKLYRELVEKYSAEEIFGILWWQIKTLLIVKNSENISESGLKPFVYNKSKGALKNFSEDDLEKFGEKLIDYYHNSRRFGANLEIKLEQFILEI